MIIRAYPPDGALDVTFGGRIVPPDGLVVSDFEAEELRRAGWEIQTEGEEGDLPPVEAEPVPTAPVAPVQPARRSVPPHGVVSPAVPAVTSTPPGKVKG